MTVSPENTQFPPSRRAPRLGQTVTVVAGSPEHPNTTRGDVSWIEADGSYVLSCGDDDEIVGFRPGTPWSSVDVPDKPVPAR